MRRGNSPAYPGTGLYDLEKANAAAAEQALRDAIQGVRKHNPKARLVGLNMCFGGLQLVWVHNPDVLLPMSVVGALTVKRANELWGEANNA